MKIANLKERVKLKKFIKIYKINPIILINIAEE